MSLGQSCHQAIWNPLFPALRADNMFWVPRPDFGTIFYEQNPFNITINLEIEHRLVGCMADILWDPLDVVQIETSLFFNEEDVEKG